MADWVKVTEERKEVMRDVSAEPVPSHSPVPVLNNSLTDESDSPVIVTDVPAIDFYS